MTPRSQNIKDFITDGIYQDVVSKLRFISKIREGEKLDIQSLQMVPADHWFSKLYRSLFSRGESRDSTFKFVVKVIGEAFELISKYIYQNEILYTQTVIEILKALEESKAGLINLIRTYHDDRMYISRIDTLINTIDTKTSDLQRQFPEVKPGQ